MRKYNDFEELPFQSDLGLTARLNFLKRNPQLFSRIKISNVDSDLAEQNKSQLQALGYKVHIEGRYVCVIYLEKTEQLLDANYDED